MASRVKVMRALGRVQGRTFTPGDPSDKWYDELPLNEWKQFILGSTSEGLQLILDPKSIVIVLWVEWTRVGIDGDGTGFQLGEGKDQWCRAIENHTDKEQHIELSEAEY